MKSNVMKPGAAVWAVLTACAFTLGALTAIAQNAPAPDPGTKPQADPLMGREPFSGQSLNFAVSYKMSSYLMLTSNKAYCPDIETLGGES